MTTQAEFETELKAKIGRPISRVTLRREPRLAVYFAAPTQEAFDTFQSLAQDGGDARGIAHRRYVEGCYAGSWPEKIGFSEACALVGPAAVAGPFGEAVNRVSGVESLPTETL